QGVGEPSGRVQQGHQIPEGRYLAEAFREVEDGLLVEDAVRAANDRACFALGLPRDSDARRQIVPIPIREGLRYSGIAEIEEARRRVLVYAAFGPRCIRGLIEVNAYAVLVVLRQQRLPAHAESNGKARRRSPRILRVEAKHVLAQGNRERSTSAYRGNAA